MTNSSEIIAWHMNKTRNIIREINDQKIGVYWCNEDTLDQKYQDGDMLVYWGAAVNITLMKETYPNMTYVIAA